VQPYLPLGGLTIHWLTGEDHVEQYIRSLDLQDGVASISLTSQDLLMNREYWTSAPDQILAVQYALQHGVGDFRIAMDSPLKHLVHTDGEYLVLSGRAPSYVSDNYRGD